MDEMCKTKFQHPNSYVTPTALTSLFEDALQKFCFVLAILKFTGYFWERSVKPTDSELS